MTITTTFPACSFAAMGGRFRTVTAAHEMSTSEDYLLLCDASGGAFTVSLPPAGKASLFNDGQIYVIKNIGATGTITVQANGAETIDGANTSALSSQYGNLMIFSDGIGWHTFGASVGAAVGAPEVLYDTTLSTWTTTNLNSPGLSVVQNNVTWRTATAAADGQNMVAANTSFGITANGLEVVGATNTRMEATTRTCQFIYTSLNELAVGLGVDIDPRSTLAFEVYTDAQNGAADHEHSGVAIYRPSSGVTSSPTLFGDEALYRAGVGFINSSANNGHGAGGKTVSATKFSRPSLPSDPDVSCVVHRAGDRHDMMVGTYTAGEFPSGHAMRACVSIDTSVNEENDIVLDPFQGFRVALYHCSENTNNTYNANHRRFRVLRV